MKTYMFLCFNVNLKHESTKTCMFSCKFAYFYPHNGKGDQFVVILKTYLNATSVMTVSISPTREMTTPTREMISIAVSASSESCVPSVLPLMSWKEEGSSSA